MNDTPDPQKPAEPEMTIDTSKMSEGKRAALEMAEGSRDQYHTATSIAGSLFMGVFPWEQVYPYPEQSDEDRAKGRPFLDKLEALLVEKADPDEIDSTGEIPPELRQELADLGAFAIKIKEEYGGLGLSQINYCRAAFLLGSYCGNLTALISAHQSIGVPQPLILFGTDEQKQKYLPWFAEGKISAFALTEEGVGSDPARMVTSAEPLDDGENWVINGEKLWCTNGTIADVIVVMARTPSKVIKGKERTQITAFIVEMDTPGVEVVTRCHFMGLRALYNGVIRFTDVKIPKENIILAEGRGLKVALATLNTGRLTLPAACVGLSKKCLAICRKWASARVQWGAPIGHHAAIADKIATIAANAYANEAMTLYTAALVDKKQGDIRLEAAMCKMWGTEDGWNAVQETLQIRGGRGFETAASLKNRGEEPIPVERFMRDCRINTLFEGSSEIMRLFIAREALDTHLKVGGAVMNPKLSGSEKLKAAGKAFGFYALWYPKQWLPGWFTPIGGIDALLAGHVRYARGTSRKLARTLFHAMARFGPRLEREQLVLGDLVDIGTELFAICTVCARADAQIKKGENADEVRQLADFFCRESRLRIKRSFRHICCNNNRRGYKLARSVLDGSFRWMEQGIVGSKSDT